MIGQASWLIQPIKGDRSKRLFGLPAPLVRDEKIAQFRKEYPYQYLYGTLGLYKIPTTAPWTRTVKAS